MKKQIMKVEWGQWHYVVIYDTKKPITPYQLIRVYWDFRDKSHHRKTVMQYHDFESCLSYMAYAPNAQKDAMEYGF